MKSVLLGQFAGVSKESTATGIFLRAAAIALLTGLGGLGFHAIFAVFNPHSTVNRV
jgi:hypothetical protein